MTCPRLLERLERAEARLARASGGAPVKAFYRDPRRVKDSEAVPDALYIDCGDVRAITRIYDVGTDTFREASFCCMILSEGITANGHG